jgi:hypothetical protein
MTCDPTVNSAATENNPVRGCMSQHAPARRRLQPASYIKAKLPLCTLGHTERKRTKHVLPALQAGASPASQQTASRSRFAFKRTLSAACAEQGHGFPALQAGAKPELFLIHATQNTACAERWSGRLGKRRGSGGLLADDGRGRGYSWIADRIT